MSELKQHQPALDLEGQVSNLITENNLVVEDPEIAKNLLNEISYFRLIKAYGLGLKPKNGQFNGTTFYEIQQLYLFNKELRHLLFPIIEHIEVALRCRIANYHSSKYGCFGYENPNNFADATLHLSFVEDYKDAIKKNKRSPFIKNFLENYEGGKVPLYALVEILSFGDLSKFFKNMKSKGTTKGDNDKKNVASTFGVGPYYLESWIESIAYVRNACAHYGRLYNVILPKRPKLYDQYSKENRLSNGLEHISNKCIFAVIVCMCHILKNKSLIWVEFINDIKRLFETFPIVDKSKVGFTEDWENVLRAIFVPIPYD